MGKYKTYAVEGYWKEAPQKTHSVVFSHDKWDGVEDAEDESIFYYAEGEVLKVGDIVSDGFVITKLLGHLS
jgi:hypothetical protein